MITQISTRSNPSQTRHQVLLIDNRCIVRQGLSTLIQQFADLAVVGELPDTQAALAQAQDYEPDVIVLSVGGSEDTSLQAIRDLRQLFHRAQVIVLGGSDAEADLVYNAVRAGALGYVSQESEVQDLVKAIRQVAQGQPTLGPQPLANLLQTISSLDQNPPPHAASQLSDREREVLTLVAEGRSNREIADALYLSESTVRSHIHNIFGKLQLTNRVQAARFVLGHKE